MPVGLWIKCYVVFHLAFQTIMSMEFKLGGDLQGIEHVPIATTDDVSITNMATHHGI